MLLQVGQQVVTRGIDVVFQYGILGFVCVIMGGIIYYYEKQRKGREVEIKAENLELKGRIDKLEDRFQTYQNTDRERLESLMDKTLTVLEDVRAELRKN